MKARSFFTFQYSTDFHFTFAQYSSVRQHYNYYGGCNKWMVAGAWMVALV
jgi:hypothetical protein